MEREPYDEGAMRRFIAEGLRPNQAAAIPARDLYRAYVEWADLIGLRPRFRATESGFGRTMKRSGLRWRHTNRCNLYLGVEPVHSPKS